MEFKQKANYFLIPQSTHFVRSQLLTGARPLCHYVTFPHTVGNHPLQGSLNNPSVRSWTRVQLPLQGSLLNPSVYSLRSQTAPDGSLSPLLLRDISPHRGESPFTRESIKSLSLFADSRPAPDGRESPLSLRDISPHRGESPFTREPFDISPHCGESPYLMQPESGCNVNSAVERDIYAKNPRFFVAISKFRQIDE